MTWGIFRLLVVAAILIFALLGLQAYKVWHETSASGGYFDTSRVLLGAEKPSLLAFGVFLGILSSAILAAISDLKTSSLRNTIRRALTARALIVAAIVAPAIMAGFYEQAIQIDSALLLFLIAYQNGFFWENVGSAARSKTEN